MFDDVTRTITMRINVIKLIAGLQIRDTASYFSRVLRSAGRRYTFVARSTHNQQLTVKFWGSISGAGNPSSNPGEWYMITGGTNQPGDPVVPASPVNQVLLGTLSEIHSYVMLQVSAGTAPTAGSLDVFVVEAI